MTQNVLKGRKTEIKPNPKGAEEMANSVDPDQTEAVWLPKLCLISVRAR